MINNTINVNYPAIYSGTDKSEIVFIDGTPDLNSIFTPGESTQRRFFVTDATIASLDCMQSFISKFDFDVCGNDILLILGSGEPYKTIESVLTIIQKAIDAGFSRNDLSAGTSPEPHLPVGEGASGGVRAPLITKYRSFVFFLLQNYTKTAFFCIFDASKAPP